MNTLINELTTRLNSEQDSITAQLAALEADYKSKRGELVAQLVPITAMLRAAKGAPVPASNGHGAGIRRGTMSEAGRESIRRALAARRERLAALATANPAESPAASSEEAEERSVTTENATGKKAAGKKAVK